MDTVLSLDHVSKVYHNGRGAKNISFSVARGQVVGLLGPNGSGKTTIMKSITGLSQPSEGSITVFGAPSTDREASLKHVGALIEQPALYENLTAWDHLVMAARFYPAVDEKRMDQVLTIVGLAPYKKRALRQVLLRHEAAYGHCPGAAVRADADDFRRADQRPGH